MRRTAVKLFSAYVPAAQAAQLGRLSSLQGSTGSASAYVGTAKFRETEAAVAEADAAHASRGFFYLPRMDYPVGDGVAPFLSKKQFNIQFNVLHKDAVDTLNRLSIGSQFEGHPLETVIRQTAFDATQAALHTAASEHFNYCFSYKSLRPWGTSIPSRFREEIDMQFTSVSKDGDGVNELKRRMIVAALSHQERCGWLYLVWNGTLFDVIVVPHGSCPISSSLTPLLCVNLHYSAYGSDYTDVAVSARSSNNQSNQLAGQTLGTPNTASIEAYMLNFFKTCNWTIADRYHSMTKRSSNEPL